MLGFLIAAGAGFLVPMLEDMIGESVATKLRSKMPVSADETKVIALLAALLIAAVLSAVFNSGTALTIAVGVTLGYFGTRLFALVKSAVDGKS